MASHPYTHLTPQVVSWDAELHGKYILRETSDSSNCSLRCAFYALRKWMDGISRRCLVNHESFAAARLHHPRDLCSQSRGTACEFPTRHLMDIHGVWLWPQNKFTPNLCGSWINSISKSALQCSQQQLHGETSQVFSNRDGISFTVLSPSPHVFPPKVRACCCMGRSQPTKTRWRGRQGYPPQSFHWQGTWQRSAHPIYLPCKWEWVFGCLYGGFILLEVLSVCVCVCQDASNDYTILYNIYITKASR